MRIIQALALLDFSRASELSGAEFTIAIRRKLDMPVIYIPAGAPQEITCSFCHSRMDLKGHHAASCGTDSHRIHRQNSDVQVLESFLKSTDAIVSRECSLGDHNRAGDLAVNFSSNEAHTFYDVSVVNPNAPSNVRQASKGPGATVAKGEQQKRIKYRQEIEANPHKRFVPFIINVQGVIGKAGCMAIKTIARRKKFLGYDQCVARITKEIAASVVINTTRMIAEWFAHYNDLH